MNRSICFSTSKADSLNEKARQIDPRLYLFAYYEPKPLVEEDHPRTRFYMTIINLYGLLWDCGPFVHKDIMYVQKEKPLANILPDIPWNERRPIQDRCRNLAETVGAFRSLWCHNTSKEMVLSREHIIVVERWLCNRCCIPRPYEALTKDDWAAMLVQLIADADAVTSDISICLDQLFACRNTPRFEEAREGWLKAIARNYITNPDYLLDAMAAFYLMYLDTNQIARNHRIPLRTQTIRWLVENFRVVSKQWHLRWLGSADNLEQNNVYQLLQQWQTRWEEMNPTHRGTLCDAAMPASSFFVVLAKDAYQLARRSHIYLNS